MVCSFIVASCLVFLTFLNAALFEELERNFGSNAAVDCTLLSQEQCPKVGACQIVGETCIPDPCFKSSLGKDCTAPCVKVTIGAVGAWCVTPGRDFSSTAAKCSLESGDTKLVEEGLCYGLTDCDTVTPLNVTGGVFYVCNEKPPATDPCNELDKDVCPYIGKCMWVDEKCVADPCWEKTYSSADSCKTGCDRKIISGSGVDELGYCKTASHDMHDKCNGGTGTNVVTKQVACTGYPTECKEIVTINNYEGGTLYVCSTAAGEFTVISAAVSLKSFAFAVSALILLVLL